ncbi:MAG: tetratricopeptide (TPR) repeat protein [Limisphaerales bacterium]|jgi:tetratricopeptide (TPR) repeat protein
MQNSNTNKEAQSNPKSGEESEPKSLVQSGNEKRQARIKQLQEFIEARPQDLFLQYALALEFGKLNQVELAIESLLKLLEKAPDYLGAYYQLGKYYELISDKEKALSIYQQGLDIAQQQGDRKTLMELKEAINLLEELD